MKAGQMPLRDTLPAIVLAYGESQPQKRAVCSGGKATTYGELREKILSCARWLQGLELPSPCVMASAAASADYVAAFLAIKLIGLAAVPVSKGAGEDEARSIAERTGSALFLSDAARCKMEIRRPLRAACEPSVARPQANAEESAAALEQAKVRCPSTCPSPALSSKLSALSSESLEGLNLPEYIDGDAITEILFTSGTTGAPKGAMLSQSQIGMSIRNTSAGMGMRGDDTVLIPLPLNHSFGLRVLRSCLYNGGTVALQSGFSFPKETSANIERWDCTALAAVVSGFEALRESMGEAWKDTFGRLRYIEFGAGAVPPDLRRLYSRELPGVRLFNTWGSTETGAALFIEFSSESEKMESAGCPISGIEAFVVGEDGRRLPAGEEGRLAIRSGAVMSGYLADAELTAKALREDGAFLASDLARMDGDGYVYLNGRADDIISVGGEKVSPAEVEKIVLDMEGVREAACIGVPDERLGEAPALFVAATRDVAKAEVEEAVRRRGSGCMVPREVVRLDALPRNYMGKLDRNALRELAARLGKEEEAGAEGEAAAFAERFVAAMVSRRSVRTFAERPVPKEVLDKLLLCARMAPSAHNMQTWLFTVLRRAENIAELKDAAARAAARCGTLYYGWNNPQALIVVSNDRRNGTGLQDSSAATENILLAAAAFGLGACWLNSLFHTSDEAEIRPLLQKYGIPDTHIVHAVVALGYPAVKAIKTPAKKEDCARYYD